ncbi:MULTISPECIES: peptide ABC transporter substrate-binding protein [Leuconostoc]|uniref:Peptide ABC transporter substrate-binding protein n=1 Tax=Leuconostoc pseudomesenteroides TaxID=33968 RepID=A0A5B8T255_LEUPS|nr:MULTISPECIES: peptide ABC transporter substrate-binding protein [Leuconostoc]MBK0040029.1 peptide ABC transporter substrate-binding protein [Leuconostoc sp. S51]MBK0050987.1 peptide ABC transporter substrate-binding protein [Leuconostoc sp. S50]MCC8439602.1 peptide ABC transporter substrate-binding protein [Leuconostoc pseudomesenteroides]MDN2451373.1 peptide ABC transporter substrate-binding protein [Leuconostoc sp. UCMA20149]NKZ35913.1 peptide ABC transporter substrate-binding protein [Le
MVKRNTIIFGTIGAIVVIAAGTRVAGVWGTSGSSSDATIKTYISTDLTTQDLSKMTDTYAFEIAGNTQEGLLSKSASGKPIAGLAKSWTTSKDGLTWTFHLRKNLKWSNGTKLTAKDFVYAWRRTVNPKTASQYAYIYSGIKNADTISAGTDKDVNSLGIVAKNASTVVVTLDSPQPQFASLMSFPSFYPQNEAFNTKAGKKLGTKSSEQIYSGPYKFVGWNGTNTSFKLIPNKNYYNAKSVKNAGVDYSVIKNPATAVQEYKRGSLDLAVLSTTELQTANSKRNDYKAVPLAATSYFEYNQTGKVKGLNNQKIRQALNLATNRSEILSSIYNSVGKVPTGMTPAGLSKTASDKDFASTAKQDYSYDLEKAKQLFAEGMKEEGLTKLNLTLELTADVPQTKLVGDFMKDSWQKLPGLTISEKFVPFKQRLNDQTDQNFDIIYVNWYGDYAEPTTFLNLFTTSSPNNDGKWSNASYDAAIKKALSTDAQKGSARDQDEQLGEKILFQDSAVNPVIWGQQVQLSNPKVSGIQYFTTGAGTIYKNAVKHDK